MTDAPERTVPDAGDGGDGAPPLSSPPQPRRRSWVVWAGVAVVMAGVLVTALLASARGGESAAEGTPLLGPEELEDIRAGAEPVRLRPDGRPLVVNFLAAWCTPCRKELPHLQAAAERLDGRVDFVGVDHKDSRIEANDLIAEAKVTFPVGFDQTGKVLAANGLPEALPITLFVAADGRIVDRKIGQLSERALDQHLDDLLQG